MAALNALQVGGYAYRAGITDAPTLASAIAIAFAESRYDPNAHNMIPPDDSYGLWQINMLGALGPERRAKYGLSSDAELLKPEVNARVMVDLSNHGRNWRPWSTYNGLIYRAAYPAALAIAASVITAGGVVETIDKTGIPAAVDAAASIPKTLGDAVQFIGAGRDWLGDRHNWTRIAWFAGGILLTYVGVILATRPLVKKAAEPIAQVVGAVVPVGKVAKAAGAAKAASAAPSTPAAK